MLNKRKRVPQADRHRFTSYILVLWFGFMVVVFLVNEASLVVWLVGAISFGAGLLYQTSTFYEDTGLWLSEAKDELNNVEQ